MVKPRGDELWLNNVRINETWQTMFDNVRTPYIMQRWPEIFVEIHPADAKDRGVENSDVVSLSSDRIPVQAGGFYGVMGGYNSFTGLMKAGNIKITKAAISAVAIVTPAIKKGVLRSRAHERRRALWNLYDPGQEMSNPGLDILPFPTNLAS